jgi:hypothetical protein
MYVGSSNKFVFQTCVPPRVARFFLVQTYQNAKNIPNDHILVYQTVIKYTKWQ